ncbi:CoA transferase [bacterium]|nr:CoA transferase [bacterium]
MGDQRQAGVLQGIRVLDLTRVLSGPYCTLILADQGAEVVKIEQPGQGDDARHLGPPYAGPDSGFFVSINRNKKSLALDLKRPEGRDLFLRLVDHADVLVENFRPGIMDRLECGYSELSKRNSRLVFCSISGFGQTGPYRDRPGYNLTVQAMSGVMTLSGEEGSLPYPIGVPVGDIPAGIYAATAIAMALYQRERTGMGRQIDISLFDALLSMVEFPIVRYGLTREIPGPMGNRHPSITPYGVFRTRDDSIAIAVGSELLWEKFCHALDREEWLADPRFATNADRTVHVDALQQEIEDSLAQNPAPVWIDRLLVNGIPVAPINRISDLYDDIHVRERGMLTSLKQPGFGAVTVAGTPIQWGQTGNTDYRPAPRLGEHTRSVLCDWLAVTADAVDEYVAMGVAAEL